MIDTDKYEGHTEGPWILGSNTEKNSNGHRTFYGTDERPIIYSDVAIRTNYKGQEMSVKIGQVNRESAQLIADAPLLLAEVKRLREENNRYLDFILWLGIEHKGKKLAWEYGDEKIVEMIE